MFDTMDDHLAAVLTFGHKMAAGNKMSDLRLFSFSALCELNFIFAIGFVCDALKLLPSIV